MKNKFSRWPPSWISDWTILAIFDLQVTQMLPTKFPSPLVQGRRRSRLLKQLLMSHDGQRRKNDARWTLTDHNSSP